MKKKTVEYYEWDYVQTAICERLDIPLGTFHQYDVNELQNPLWEEWTEYFNKPVNGAILPVQMGEPIEDKISMVTKEGKEWLIPFVRAVYDVWEEYKIEYIEYYW